MICTSEVRLDTCHIDIRIEGSGGLVAIYMTHS